MGSQEGPIESTEDAAIANQQPIAGKTKVDTLANGDIRAADDESLVGAPLDAITSLVEKDGIQAGTNGNGTVVAKMVEEVVRDAELGSNTSQKEIQSFDSNKGIIEEHSTSIGMEQQDTHEFEQAEEDAVRETDIDRVGSTIIVENSSEQAHVQEGSEEEKPQKPSLLGEDKADGLENSGLEEATGLNEENLLQEFSSREDKADEDVKNNDSAGDLKPTSTSIDQDEASSEQILEVQERPIVVEDGIQREPIAHELALPGQDEIVHEAQWLTTLDESTEHLQGDHEAPQTEFEGVPEQEVATHAEVENISNEVSDSLPTQGEVVEEAPTTALVTDVEDVSPTPAIGVEEESAALKGEDCDGDESTGYTRGVDEASNKEWESKGVADVTPTLENDVDEALSFEEPAHVVGNDNSSSLPMQDEVIEEAPTAVFVNIIKDMSPTPVKEEPIVGGEEEYVASKVEVCDDVESKRDAQGADETPTSPVEVEESTNVVDQSNVLETPPKEEVSPPASTQFEGEPELSRSIDGEVDSVKSTEAPLPLEEHADDVKNNSSQVSDSLPTQDEIVEEVPTCDDVSTAEDVSSTLVDEEHIGGREEESVALKADDSTKHVEGVDEEPVEVHESKEVADESNLVKDELTEVNELVEVNTEDDVKSREAPLPLEDVNNGGEEEYVASKVEDESTNDVQRADETPTSPVEESTDVAETPPIEAKEEVISASSQLEGEPELVDVEVSTEDSVESTEASVPLEEHADDVKNNGSQVSDSLPTQDEIVEEVPTGPIATTAEEVSSTPVDEDKHIEVIEEEPVEVHEKDVTDESTVVKDELTEVNTEDGLVEGNTEGEVKFREAPLPLEEPVGNDSNEVLGTLPMQDEIVEEDATIPHVEVEDVVVEAKPVAGGENESLVDESTKHTGGVDEAPAEVEEEPKDVADESSMVGAEVTPTVEDDVGSREAQVANSNEDSHSLLANDENAEEAPGFEDVSPPAREEEPTVGGEEKSVKVEDSEVEESAQGVETPVEVEESTDVVDEKVIPASNQEEPDVEFREATLPSHDETVEEASTTALLSSVEPTAMEEEHLAGVEEEPTALSVEDCTVISKHAGVDEAPPATTEIDDSKEVVHESNGNETPLVEEEPREVVEESIGNVEKESKEVVDESNGNETPLVKEEPKEVVDESNANETPLVEEEFKEVVDESNANETPLVEEESKEVVDESNGNEAPLVDEESKEVVDESNGNETPLVDEESKEVVDESNGNETPLVEEESKEVVDESNGNEAPLVKEESKKVVDESNANETPLAEEESKEVVEEYNANETPLVEEESKEVVDESSGNETPPVEQESKEVVDESNGNKTPLVEEESKEVVDANETPLVEEESKEVDDESNATETPTVKEEESKEVVDESNVIEAPSTIAEEEVNPASTQFEEEPEVAEVAQDHTESKGEGEVKEAPTLPLVTNVEDVTSTEEEALEEESVASNIGDSTKHWQGVVLSAASDVEESKDVVDELNVLETPSPVVEEEVTPASTESEGGPEEVAKYVEVTTEPLALEEEPTQDSSNEVLATQDEIVEEVPTTLTTNAEDVGEDVGEVGGEEESLAPKVEESDADESRKHTAEDVEETGQVDESKDVVDDLETSSTVVDEATSTPVEVDGAEKKSPAKHTERVDETPTEVADDDVGGGEEHVAEGDNDVDQQVDSNLVDSPSTRVEDEVTPTSAKHEGEPLAGGEVEVNAVEPREMPMEVSVGNNSIEGASALSGQGEAAEEAPVTSRSALVEEELADNVVGGEEEPMAATEADEAPSELEMVDKFIDLEAPSTTVEDEVTPTSHEEPVAPESIDSEAEDVMEDAIESLEEEPAQVIDKSSSEEPTVLPRHEEVVVEGPTADAPLASVKPTQVEQAGEHEVPKAEDDLPRELNAQHEGVGDGVGSSSEFEAETQKATTNGVPRHEDVAGDISEEETESKEASMDGWSTNGGLVASTLRTIVTTTMNLVKTTKPSKKKRMKLKKELAKKMQQV